MIRAIRMGILLLGLLTAPTAFAEVTLRIMTWLGYSPDAQVAEFERRMSEKYAQKVSVKIHYINGYDEAFSLLRRGEADICVLVDHILHDGRYQFIANKLILPLDLSKLPNFADLLPTFKPYVEHRGETYAAPIAAGPYGLAYNTRYFDEPPTSWNILWDPKYRGQYAITNGIFEVNLYVTALAMGYTRDQLGDFDALNQKPFRDKLRQLVENAESFWPGIDEPHHLKGLKLATSWGFSLPGLRELGEDWRMAEPEEGSPAWIDVHAINQSLADEPTKLAIAHDWIDYTLSADFQYEVIVTGIGTPPVTLGAQDRLSPAQAKAFRVGDKDFFERYRVTYPTIKSERTRNGIKFLWESAISGISKPERSVAQNQ